MSRDGLTIRRVDSRESNLSGSDPGSPLSADWAESACDPSDPGYYTTGQIKWSHFSNEIYYPPFLYARSTSGVRWSTCRLIDRDRILTAGHSFDFLQENDSSGYSTPTYQDPATGIWYYHPPANLARMMMVSFRYRCSTSVPSSVLETEQEFPIIELNEYRLGGYDYAIARISGDATGVTGGVARLSLEHLRLGARISIVHHPAGDKAKNSPGKIVCFRSVEIDDVYTMKKVKVKLVEHDADTLPGSSGGGAEGDLGQIGVHTAGKCQRPSLARVVPCGRRANVMVPIQEIIVYSAIITELFARSRHARRLLADSHWRDRMLSPVQKDELALALRPAAKNGATIGAVGGAVAGFFLARLLVGIFNPKLPEPEKWALSGMFGLTAGAAAGSHLGHAHARQTALRAHAAAEGEEKADDLDLLHIHRARTPLDALRWSP